MQGSKGDWRQSESNNAVLVTAARVRFLLNLKGYGLGGSPRRQTLDAYETSSLGSWYQRKEGGYIWLSTLTW